MTMQKTTNTIVEHSKQPQSLETAIANALRGTHRASEPLAIAVVTGNDDTSGEAGKSIVRVVVVLGSRTQHILCVLVTREIRVSKQHIAIHFDKIDTTAALSTSPTGIPSTLIAAYAKWCAATLLDDVVSFHVFARRSDEYVLPGSAIHPDKRTLSAQALVRWWLRRFAAAADTINAIAYRRVVCGTVFNPADDDAESMTGSRDIIVPKMGSGTVIWKRRLWDSESLGIGPQRIAPSRSIPRFADDPRSAVLLQRPRCSWPTFYALMAVNHDNTADHCCYVSFTAITVDSTRDDNNSEKTLLTSTRKKKTNDVDNDDAACERVLAVLRGASFATDKDITEASSRVITALGGLSNLITDIAPADITEISVSSPPTKPIPMVVAVRKRPRPTSESVSNDVIATPAPKTSRSK